MARKKVINELNLSKDQEFERLSAHLKVTGEVRKLELEPVVPVERAPWGEETPPSDIGVEPEQWEEAVRSVELPQEIKTAALLGDVKLIRQVGNMQSGYQAPITRIDDSGRVYFMNGDTETYFDTSEKGRLFVTTNAK